jgi:hypothetical protein
MKKPNTTVEWSKRQRKKEVPSPSVVPSDDVTFFTRKEAAAKLRMSLATLDRRIGSGKLEAKKHGRATVVLPDAITRYLENLPDIKPRA